MRKFAVTSVLFLSFLLGSLPAQHAIDPTSGYHRLICLVPLTGTGEPSDPIRPEYAPAASAAYSAANILAWSFQLTDDKKMAVVHYVAKNRTALLPILSDKAKRSDIRVFEIGVDSRESIEAELKKFKKDFNIESLQVVVR